MDNSTQAPPASKLKQGITGPMLYLFILGDVLGAGIYALVGEVSGEVGGAIWMPLVVALVLALLTAASYAELVTKYPKAGGGRGFRPAGLQGSGGFVPGRFCHAGGRRHQCRGPGAGLHR